MFFIDKKMKHIHKYNCVILCYIYHLIYTEIFGTEEMVKNTKGGNRARKMSSFSKQRDVLPQEQELVNNTKETRYVIGKVTEYFNNKHVNIVTMDGRELCVFCSINNNVSRVSRGNHVLLYTPNTEYYFKRATNTSHNRNERYKSVILAVLDHDKLTMLISKYSFLFIEPSSEDKNGYVVFDEGENEDPSEIDLKCI